MGKWPKGKKSCGQSAIIDLIFILGEKFLQISITCLRSKVEAITPNPHGSLQWLSTLECFIVLLYLK